MGTTLEQNYTVDNILVNDVIYDNVPFTDELDASIGFLEISPINMASDL